MRPMAWKRTKEVWSVSLLAMLTTAVSFAFLFISGFSALAQIGYLSALGVMFTYIFVAYTLPRHLSYDAPCQEGGVCPLRNFVNKAMGSCAVTKFTWRWPSARSCLSSRDRTSRRYFPR